MGTGRNEIFKFHTKEGVVNDINSSYPWAMTQQMPKGGGHTYVGDLTKEMWLISNWVIEWARSLKREFLARINCTEK